MAHCEHIIVWHINADEYAAVAESCNRTLSKPDKYVVLGPKYLDRLVETLIDKEKSNAESIVATSKPSTTKPVDSIVPENNPAAGVQSVPAVVPAKSVGSILPENSSPAGESAKVDGKSSEPQCKPCMCAKCKVPTLGELSGGECCGLLCILVGIVNGCYIVGYYFVMLISYLVVKESDWIGSSRK